MLTLVPGSLLVLDATFASVARSIGEAFGCKVVILGSQADGITQITSALADGPRPTALHIVTHGSEGNIRLGPTVLDASALTDRADEIAGWGRTLGSEGSILLYGCDVAGGTDGAAFVTRLAEISGVAVAASTNATGPLVAGGDWILETATGPVAPALSLDQIGSLLETGNFIVGDGSGGGGGSSVQYAAPGGHGGGSNDTLIGGSGDDVIIGDGSGGGGAGKYSGATAAGGQAGSGNDLIMGGAGNDILIGDGFNGEAGGLNGGRGGYGGGGGGAAGASYSSGDHAPGRGGDGGVGAGGGGGGWSEGGTGNNGGNGGIGAGGGGGGGSNAGSGVDGTLSGSAAGGLGGTDTGSALSGSGGGGYFGAAGGRYSYGDKPSNGGDGANAAASQGNGGTGWGADGGHTPIIAAAGGGGFGNGNGGNGGHMGTATVGGSGDTATYTMPDTAGAVWTKVDADLTSGMLAGITSSFGAGGGADILNGGQGSDHLLGLGGADLFVIDSTDAGVNDIETIWDFNLAQGDQIGLSQQGVQLDHAALTTLLATQTTVGVDRQVVFSDGAGHSQTLVVKGIDRDLTAGDFRNRPAFAGDLNGDGVYDQAVTVQEDGTLSLNALLAVTGDKSGQTLTWTLAAGPSAGTGAVTVTGATATSTAGQVTPSGTVLYTPPANAAPASQFTVQVDDGQSGRDTMVVNVQVLDRAPVLAGATQGVAENIAAGVTLHTVDTSAGDQTGLTNWQILTGNDDGVFTISSGGAISIAAGKSLDYEGVSKSYTLGVQVQDEGGTTAQAQVTFNVTNVNEAPGTISLTQAPVTDVSAAGATVGNLSAVDPEGDQIIYAITSGGADFALDGATLTLARTLTAGNHSVTVRAQDPGGLNSTNTFTVSVADVNEAPGTISLTQTPVTDVSAAGATVGSLSAVDPEGDQITYAITSGGTDFALDGATLTLARTLTAGNHSVTVRAQDPGGLNSTNTFTVSVADVNEAPGTISLTQTPVTDASTAGATVGSLSAVDPEGDQITYAITSGGTDFALDGATLTLARTLTAGNHSVTVRAQDPGGLNSTNTFTVPVGDGTAPVVTITGDSNTPRPGDTVAVAFTLSEAATDFTAGDVTVTGGTLSGFTGTGTAYTATFTAGAEGPSTIRVDAGTFNDAAGNTNAAAGELALTVTAAVLDITGVGTDLREGNTDTTAFTFTVQRSGNSRGAVTADWAVTGAAITGDDFDGGVLPTGTVAFADGETTATVTVQVAGDSRIEPDEAFTVVLSNPVGARIAGASADATILNDDVAQGGGGGSSSSTTTTVDGATVTRTTTTTSDGRIQEVTTIAPITAGRTDPADVPLAEDDGASTPALTVSLPAGVGLRTEGSPTRLSRQDALSDLVARIKEKTGSATEPQQEMTGIGQSFLNAIPENSQLYVKTVTPSLAAGAQNGEPITITGAGASLTGDQQEALVIDVSGLPSGTVLRLDDVDFAAIIGEARVIGGAGRNVVTGDDSAQIIVLGADDDLLHGGAGDDTIGSEGGRDILHGDAGNDTVFGGADHDFIVGGTGDDTLRGDAGMDALRFDVGHATAVITRNATERTLTVTSADGTDSISTAEILVFSDRVDLALAPVLTAGGFDEAAYLSANPDVAAAVSSGLLSSGLHHFGLYGEAENRAPNPLFDGIWYLVRNPDVAAAVAAGQMTAWQHYTQWGWAEDRDAGPFFDQSRYLEDNPNVAEAGMNALMHYLHFGWAEGRAAHLADDTVFG